jgi:hypothetical protein
MVEKEKREGNAYGEGDNNQEVFVRVKDIGSGIGPRGLIQKGKRIMNCMNNNVL